MTQKWLDAAEKYRQRGGERVLQKMIERQGVTSAAEETEAKIGEAVFQLQRFLNSTEGHAAFALLEASGRHLIFGEERGGGLAVVDFIDGTGLYRSVESHGMWTAYANKEEIQQPTISFITAEEAIRTAVFFGKQKPEKVLPWLRRELDKIAEAIG